MPRTAIRRSSIANIVSRMKLFICARGMRGVRQSRAQNVSMHSISQKKDRSRVDRVTATSCWCDHFAAAWSSCQKSSWYFTRDRFGEFFPETAIAMRNWPTFDTRSTAASSKNSRERTPSKTRVIPRDTVCPTRKDRAYAISGCILQTPLCYSLLAHCFCIGIRVCVRFIILWEIEGVEV